MSTNDEDADFLTTANALVGRFLRSLNQSGRSDMENVQALAGVVLWTAMHDLDGENEDIKTAREFMVVGAVEFECAVRQAKAAAVEIEAS